LGSTSAKISTRSVMISVASATPLSPNIAGEKRRRQRGGEDVDQVVAQKDRADQPLVILGDLKRLGRARASPCRRGCAAFPREAAVSAVSLPEKKPDKTRRQMIAPEVIQKAASSEGMLGSIWPMKLWSELGLWGRRGRPFKRGERNTAGCCAMSQPSRFISG
jgi:hypothetical protein